MARPISRAISQNGSAKHKITHIRGTPCHPQTQGKAERFVQTSLREWAQLLCQTHRQRLKRGVFRSVAELQAAILHFIDEANQEPKPFIWTADPRKFLGAVKRGRKVLDSIH
jgi:transposase InsO family protein